MTKVPVLACLLTILAAGAACQDASERVFAQRGRPEATPAVNDAAKTVVVEFDAGAAVTARNRAGQFEVTAFQVGFFDGPGRIVRTIEIPREKGRITGTTVRLEVPLVPIDQQGDADVSIHVRTLSSGPLGPWSGSAGNVTLPMVERVSRRQLQELRQQRQPRNDGNTRAPERRLPKTLDTKNLDQLPQLKAALLAQLDKDFKVADALEVFNRPQDLALILTVSRTNDISFTRICRGMRGKERGYFFNVLQELKPGLDVRAAMRAARADAQRLLTGGR